MSNQMFDRLWHQKLGRPYRLAKRLDSGSGSLVVLLHGIGRTGEGWKHLVALLQNDLVRVVAFDLLGFGDSPKPNWLKYDAEDHAAAVISSIERLQPTQPVIVVGHSMGCLVAVRVARKRPDLVRHLVLYEMPLYKGLPNKRYYRLRLNFYTKIYKWMLKYEPKFDSKDADLSDRLAQKFTDLKIDPVSWLPYVRSLQNTIYEQTTPEDIADLSVPMDVIYGRLDMLVIRGTVKYVYGKDNDRLHVHTVRASHRISKKASLFIRQRIVAALASSPDQPTSQPTAAAHTEVSPAANKDVR